MMNVPGFVHKPHPNRPFPETFIHSNIRKKHSEASGARALFGGSGRAFSLEVGSFAPTLKFSGAPGVLRTRFFARPGPLGLGFGSCGRCRVRFWRAKRLDFRGLRALVHVRC